MATDQDERPRFFEDQYLGADDLNLAVDYSRVQDARHALGSHTWGIALGLEVQEQTRANGEIDVYISPGYAWDGFGRPIIVLEPVPIPVGLFQGIAFQQGIDDRTPEGRLLAIWLLYQEQAGQGPLPGFEACNDERKSRRIRETFVMEVSAFQPPSPPPLEGAQDNIVVNGTSIAAKDALKIPLTSNPSAPITEIPDRSIPFQEFPSSDEPKRWLVPVGLLRWKPSTAGLTGKFIMRNQADIAENRRSRRYIGVVAESIQSADGHLRIKPRSALNSSLWTDDLLWVEGKLRIEGDTRLLGGALHFRNGADDPQKSSALIKRAETSSGTALQAGIEKDRQGLNVNRVAIGTINGSGVEEHVVILDNGKVGMGTPTPTGRLTLKGIKEPQGLLTMFSDGADGADIEYDGGSDKLFVFKHTDAAGKTAFMGGNVGIGTPTPSKPLGIRAARQGEELIGFEDPQGQVKWHLNQNLGGVNPGLNFAETGVADGRLFIQARSGNVGIGTTNPTEKLEVAGNIKFTGLINGHDLDAELQALSSAKRIVAIEGEVPHGGNIWFGNSTGLANEIRIVSLKNIILQAPIPTAWYEIECSYVPITGTIPAGQQRGEVIVKCVQKLAGVTLSINTGTASYLVIGYES